MELERHGLVHPAEHHRGTGSVDQVRDAVDDDLVVGRGFLDVGHLPVVGVPQVDRDVVRSRVGQHGVIVPAETVGRAGRRDDGVPEPLGLEMASREQGRVAVGPYVQALPVGPQGRVSWREDVLA